MSPPLFDPGATPGPPPAAATVQIELDALSGRPNPIWQLDVNQANELLALLANLPAAAPRPLAGMGYRGFLVHQGAAGSAVAAPPLRVFAGGVEIDAQPYLDLRGAEAWLLRNARAMGWAAVVEGISAR